MKQFKSLVIGVFTSVLFATMHQTLAKPMGIAVNSFLKMIYISDTDHNKIDVYGFDNKYQFSWGTHGTVQGQFNSPTAIAVNNLKRKVYVADKLNNRIERFSSDGNFELMWGEYGTGQGQFQDISGVAVNSRNGDVYVAEVGNHRVQHFDKDGKYLGQWTVPSQRLKSVRNERFTPLGIGVDSVLGDVFVLDARDHAQTPSQNWVLCFSSNGTFKYGWGDKDPAFFEHPLCLAADSLGHVCIGDYVLKEYWHNGYLLDLWPRREEPIYAMAIAFSIEDIAEWFYILKSNASPSEVPFERIPM